MRVPLSAAAALLALASCSPAPEGNESGPTAAVNVSAPAAPSANTAEVVHASATEQGERRCGWLFNPTPGNWWLTDRDGEWILAAQGSEQAPGMDDIPDMSTAGWVETNGHYGYGCACITIAHDPATRRVTRIADAEPKPLSQCEADRSLPRPD